MEKYFHFDRSKSLEDLDKQDWGIPNFDSHLVSTCHELRKIPLTSFSIEDLRLMICQNINLEFLIPLALELLDDNVLVAGDYYSGDLLEAVLKVNPNFWRCNPSYKNDLEKTLERNIIDLNLKLSNFNKLL